jgi:hypothetical protein
MVEITEKQWKEIPGKQKRKTPLTRLRQFLFTNKDNPEGMWITETVNFIILDKEGGSHGSETHN